MLAVSLVPPPTRVAAIGYMLEHLLTRTGRISRALGVDRSRCRALRRVDELRFGTPCDADRHEIACASLTLSCQGKEMLSGLPCRRLRRKAAPTHRFVAVLQRRQSRHSIHALLRSIYGLCSLFVQYNRYAAPEVPQMRIG
jgi:hypothetical protein